MDDNLLEIKFKDLYDLSILVEKLKEINSWQLSAIRDAITAVINYRLDMGGDVVR